MKNQAVPLLSKSLKTKTKEMLGVSVLAILFGIASINGLHPFGLSFLAANVLYRRRYILPTAFSSFRGFNSDAKFCIIEIFRFYGYLFGNFSIY